MAKKNTFLACAYQLPRLTRNSAPHQGKPERLAAVCSHLTCKFPVDECIVLSSSGLPIKYKELRIWQLFFE
ncbi:hypothetical protein OIU77_011724 [Salix suchowensis]|uniref:Uncharacterized protein n=1 Tax=Salix suchowensis TaxID=1278906 RepID=A0ABQ9A185_9ROSI|nr:hypothetical protein OIU77_011724 [Salix suchowensis]